jgi:hypothetical protein
MYCEVKQVTHRFQDMHGKMCRISSTPSPFVKSEMISVEGAVLQGQLFLASALECKLHPELRSSGSITANSFVVSKYLVGSLSTTSHCDLEQGSPEGLVLWHAGPAEG